jgi:hypothetical protein
MKGIVIQVVAVTALSLLTFGCAGSTTSAHGSRYSLADLDRAEREAERAALARMSDSWDLETAQAARHIALAEGR